MTNRLPALRSRIYVHRPSLRDAREFLAAARRSRALHHPWTSAPATRAAFRAYAERMALPGNRAFFVRRRDDDALVGVFNITNIVLGAFRSAYLGYYAFAGHERQGLMREGLAAVLRQAFR